MTIKEFSLSDIKEVFALYTNVGWKNYIDNPEMLVSAYKNSLLTLGAYDGDRLVGIVRTVGDGYSVVYVQDILIRSDYQRQGIGTKLLRKILDAFPNVYQMVLLTDNSPKTAAFYKSLGFVQVQEKNCSAFMKS